MNIERYDAVPPGRTRSRYSYLFHRPDDSDACDTVIRSSSQVTAGDIAICESVQRNLDSGTYNTGWLSPKHEGGVAAFQRWVREAVERRP
jgi:choline monooxygenase